MSSNGFGINAFSGPMGQKEPAYGLAERLKILSKVGVKPPPSVNAARQSQRRATGQTRARQQAAEAPTPPQSMPAEQAPVATYDQQLAQFWTELASQPGASPLVQQMAAMVNGG